LWKILAQIPNADVTTRKSIIRKYLEEYDFQIKKDYQEASDEITKKEIQEIYKQYYSEK
jgi:hypothetical protein